ncbi:MAG: hypothetical protein JRN68_04645 [Nitrososphaerota archaeon]|jgi:hypothetical protein|nr:hypothetical protein [Nitrososphaerota archaeon]
MSTGIITARVHVELQEVCIFAVYKLQPEPSVLPLTADEAVYRFVEEHIIGKFLTKLKGVKVAQRKTISSSSSFLRAISSSSNDFCKEAVLFVKKYADTPESRSALVVVAKFKVNDVILVGFFQMHESAVVALYPQRQELSVIERAFRKFEKAFTIPSVVEGYGLSIYQRSDSGYFEDFAGVDRPPTAEEMLAEYVRVNRIDSFSQLVDVANRDPFLAGAKVQVKIANASAKVRLDEVISNLGKVDSTLVLVREGEQAVMRIGRKGSLRIDNEGLVTLKNLLAEKHLLR